ncbi:hypothetical protein TREMEDRAFT_65080 [Tremella mesenterica DSM 1558]|uniref:uncharacterized protein n=1 Tax=Tremella mesenterica (strain ATCC 24925 / CBS 8224 / DSM 1558 / NBRC 9311 / NRRL Y-6157 / RJB 2259-6 / UBC 559-6) TaxID=578456 RepID=UPI00032BEB52|nr:uncharacterized protein TREMEDRAFT_65080 [Tremella mesenterica DSM 1558]EIW66688.1 hypothetical protein TREMEDRAFT_65080 [Tremella mesenterica DSM 1558]
MAKLAVVPRRVPCPSETSTPHYDVVSRGWSTVVSSQRHSDLFGVSEYVRGDAYHWAADHGAHGAVISRRHVIERVTQLGLYTVAITKTVNISGRKNIAILREIEDIARL